MIMEDDYGDENMLAPLLRDDGPSDFIPLRQTGSALGNANMAIVNVDSLNNSDILKKIVQGSFPVQDENTQDQEKKLTRLLERSNSDKEALQEFGTALSKLRKKREERATKQGAGEMKRMNRLLEVMEAKLLSNLELTKVKQKAEAKESLKM